ncbi:AcrB/AcrD/AcrF family protein [candidate division KSB1 bacterium]|nr:AcrB/AcrD/AcrF family protein [candidate division KSB1 bacterium]
MRLPKLAIENHQFTTIILFMLLIAGLSSFMTMPRSEDPLIEPVGTSVIVVFPGATPADLEELVIDPVESSLNELDDIKEIESQAEDGLAITTIEFLPHCDPDEKYSDVVQKVNSIRNDLPRDILSLELLKWSILDVSILQMALVSDSAAYRELENCADELKERLEKTSGIKDVKLWGIPTQQVRISLDFAGLARRRIAFNHILQSIQDANANIPGGYIDIGSRRLNIKTSGSYQTLDDIRNTVIKSSNGKNIYLSDVATVEYDLEDINYQARADGRRAVFINVQQKAQTNIFSIMKALQPKLYDFKNSLPKSIDLEIVFDQSKSVSRRLNGFFINLLQGIVLVGIVIFTAVNWRASVIVMLAIPFSIFIAIGFVDLSRYGMQQMSIAGLVIALGLLVDNAIVVTENISRFLKKGYSHLDAAIAGTVQIGWAIVSSTVTTVLAFIPIILMRDMTGDFIRSMPVTVVFTLLASLLISLTFTPFMSSRFLKRPQKSKSRRVEALLQSFIHNRYQPALQKALNRPKTVLALVFFVFLCSLLLFNFVGFSYFPKAGKPMFFINIDLPQGTGIDATDRVVREVESYLDRQPLVKNYASNVGHGNPRIYYNVVPERTKSNHAQIFVQLKEYEDDSFTALLQSIREKYRSVPGAKIKIKELEQGPPVEAPIAIKILGNNLEILRQTAYDIEAMISGQAGTINITNPLRTSKSDLRVDINRDKARMYGVPLTEIDRTVRAAIAGLEVSEFRDTEGKEYPIVVRLATDKPNRLHLFDDIYITSLAGAMIPLKQLASIDLSASPLEINHYNLERAVTLTADVESGYSVDRTTRRIIEKMEDYQWRRGYHYFVGGELESRQESFGGMFKAILIAMITIFGVLVLQFHSFRQPLIIFSAIPLAIIGSVLGLFFSGNTFSFSAFIGLISLVGIVVNNSIILVDYINQLISKEDLTVRQAIVEAGRIRFIPIILTTATTIMGLLPLTLIGGSMWAPMGWTIIGGLLVSTFLTLIIVPVLYKLLTRRHAPIHKGK